MKFESQLQIVTAAGVPPLTVNQTQLVINLNADLLDGQHGSFYQNAGNLNAGTVPSARLSGSYNIDITGSSAFVFVNDTRNNVTGPQTGYRQVRADFLANSTDGLSDGGIYHGVLTFQQWADASGGGTRQLAFTDNDNLWLRGSGGALTAYGSWKLMLNSVNYSSYALPLTGGTLTGKLSINSTGAWNDAQALLTVGSGGDGRIQVRHIWGKSAANNNADHLWLNYQNANGHVQIGDSGGGNNLYVSGQLYAGGYFGGSLVLHAGNYGSYSTFTGTVTGTNFSGPGTGLTGTASSLTAGAVPWSGVTGKPTTLSGYGITDAMYQVNPNGFTQGDINGSGNMQRLWGTDSVQNLIAFRPPTTVEYTVDGVNWVATTISSDVFDGKVFGKWGGFNMNVGSNIGAWTRVRMTWVNFGYHFFSHFTLAHSTNGHSMNFVFYKSDLNGVFGAESYRVNGISSWPGYTFTSHVNVSGWWDTRDVRMVFELIGNNGPSGYPNNAISVGHIGIMGGFSSFNRVFDWDGSRNITLYGNLTLPGNVSATGTVSGSSFSGAGTNLTGTANSLNVGGSAARWATGRTIALTGDVTATSGTFDGTANLSFAATIANSAVTYAKIQNVAVSSVLGNSSASVSQAPAALSMATLAGMLSGQTMNIAGSSTSCTGNAATATNVAWSGITSKPTTLGGFGITDAFSSSGGAITGAVSIVGQTINGQSHFQWEGATYRNPGDWTATLIARRDNTTAGLNGSIPALVLYNNNGGDQTTVGLSFASAEGATGQGNAVALAGIVARKEGAGSVGAWSSGSLNFYVKNSSARVDAINISSTGTVNALVALQQGGNQVLHAGNYNSYAMLTTGIPSGSDQYVNFRVIRNSAASPADGMYIGYGNASSGRTRIYGEGSTSGHIYPDASGNLFRSDGATYLHSSNYTSYAAGLGTYNTLTNVNQFRSNVGNGIYLGASNNPPLQAFSNDGGAAFMSFHRSGSYAVNLGLDPDNVLRIGGWSASANRWALDMSGNQTLAGTITATGGTFSGTGSFTGQLNANGGLALGGPLYYSQYTRRQISIAGPSTANFGNWKQFIRLWPTTGSGGNLFTLKVSVRGTWNYGQVYGTVEAYYTLYVPGDGTINATRDFRIIHVSGPAADNVRLGDVVIENGYASIPVWAANTNLLEATVEQWFGSQILGSTTAAVSETLPAFIAPSFRGGLTSEGALNVTGALTGTTGTFSGAVQVNNDSGVRASYDNGGSYAWLYGYGVEFGRVTSYVRPSTNRSATLFVGGPSINSLDWLNIDFYSSGRFTINNNTILHAGNYSSYALPLSGGTLTGGLSGTSGYFSGDVTWSGYNSGNARAVRIGYSGGNYGGISYGINYTATAGSHTYAFADAVTRIDLADGIQVYSAATGTVGAAVSWTTLLTAYRGNASLQWKGANVLDANNYTNYTLPRGGSWYGVSLPGSRWGGFSANGGEVVFGQDLPNTGQMGVLIDGCYIAGENNGFWSLGNSNDWTTRRGMYFDGTYLRFDYNSATAYFSNASINGNQVLHAGNYSSYALPLSGGTLTGALSGTSASFSGALSSGGNSVLTVGNYSSYAVDNTKRIKQFFWDTLSASTTQARRFEIARIAIDIVNWNQVGTFEIELSEQYWSNGLKKKYVVSYGYNSPRAVLKLVDMSGAGSNNFQVVLGSEQLVSGNHYYLPVYVDVRYYAYVDVRVTTSRLITFNSTPPVGYTYINTAPTPTNITDFGADSTVDISNAATAWLVGGNALLHAGNVSTYALPIGGGTLTGTLTTPTLQLANGFQIQQGASNYGQFNTWVHLNGSYGFYSGVNSAHLYPNNGSYGSWRMDGSRNGWGGIEFGNGVSLMMGSDTVGFHQNTNGWLFRVHNGTGFIHKGSWGGGTTATIFDSENYTAYLNNTYLRAAGHPGYGDWNTFGNTAQTVHQMYQENFNLPTSTGSSNFPTNASYKYGTLINFSSGNDARAQVYISHAGNDLVFRGGWGTASWHTWNRCVTDVNFPSFGTHQASIGNSLPTTVFMSTDANIRQAPFATAKAHLGITSKWANSRPNLTGDSNYWTGVMGWGTTDWNSIFDWGSGFTDSWSSPANNPGDSSHHTGIQVVHYTNGSSRYGWQIVGGAGNNRLWLRSVWGGSFTSWYELLHGGNYNNYAPTLTGGGASGSWGINITGSSASCTGNAATCTTANGIADGTVSTTAKLANSVVTYAKIQNVTAYTVLGNSSPSAAQAPVEINMASLASMLSGNTMNISGSSTSCSGNAATATTSVRSTIEDTRAAQRTPNNYDDYRASYEFTNQITGIGDWHSAITLQGWHDGYAAWQIIGPSSTSAHENFYLRSGVNTTWNTLRTILHSGNYTSYSPSLTGSGASGTWGINITGSSASCTGNAATASAVAASGITGQTGMWTSAARPGPYRLYRRDNDSNYSVQTYWTGSYWRLYGYSGDTAHADTHVGYADSAGSVSTIADGAVSTTAKLANSVVTYAKIQNVGASSVLGNTSASVSQAPQEITFANLGPYINGVARAWVTFNENPSTGAITVNASFGISSVTRLALGVYQINFSSAFADANYAVSGTIGYESISAYTNGGYLALTRTATPKATTSCEVCASYGGTNYNARSVHVVFHR